MPAAKNIAFLLHPDELQRLLTLRAEDFKAVFSVLARAMGIETDAENASELALFAGSGLVDQFHRDQARYDEICARNRKNAGKRWHGPGSGGIRPDAGESVRDQNQDQDQDQDQDQGEKKVRHSAAKNLALDYDQRDWTPSDQAQVEADSAALLARYGLPAADGGDRA